MTQENQQTQSTGLERTYIWVGFYLLFVTLASLTSGITAGKFIGALLLWGFFGGLIWFFTIKNVKSSSASVLSFVGAFFGFQILIKVIAIIITH